MIKLINKFRWGISAFWLPAIFLNLSGCLDNGSYSTSVLHSNGNHHIGMLIQENPSITTETLEVQIGTPSQHLPPYFIDWNKRGIELDILREAFQKSYYQTIFSARHDREEKFFTASSGLDCISTVTEELGYDGFYSDDVVVYQDVAIYLKDSGLTLETKAELADKRIEAFTNARELLDIQDIVADNLSYHEHSGEASQVLLLYRDKIDVLLMDKYLFFYFRNKVQKLIDMEREVVMRPLFPKRAYKILCKQEKMRDDFNQGLAALHAEGRYQQIIEHYL